MKDLGYVFLVIFWNRQSFILQLICDERMDGPLGTRQRQPFGQTEIGVDWLALEIIIKGKKIKKDILTNSLDSLYQKAYLLDGYTNK